MQRLLVLAAAAALSFSLLPAQQPASAEVLSAHDLAAGSVQLLELPEDPAGAVRVAVALDRDRELALVPFDVRTPGFRLLVHDDAGVRRVATPPSVTWRGSVLGAPDSFVAATLTDEGLRAVVRLSRAGGSWGVQPLGGGMHLVYRDRDGRNLPFRCGTRTPLPGAAVPRPLAPPESGMVTFAEIACDADHRYFQARGSSATTVQNDITGVINAVDAIFQRDVTIGYQITTILVRASSGADPYTTDDPSGLLGQFRSEWNANQSAIQRDVAHLFTGRNMTGPVIGIAYLDVICQIAGAYGVSQTTFSSNLTARVGLTAHELGHNWGAFHCNGDPDCRIMCSGLGGCSNNLGAFGSRSVASISRHRDTRLCLSLPPPPPVVTSVSPGTVPSFQPPEVTVSGSGFSISTSLQLGGVTLLPSQDYRIVDDSTIRLTPPAPGALGPVPLTVTSPSGTGGPVPLVFGPTDPPGLAAPIAAIGGFQAPFSFGGRPQQDWLLLVSVSSATAPLQGAQVLRDFSILGIGSLDGAGLGSLTLPVPRLPARLTFYTQLLTFDPSTLALLGASGVSPTTIL